MFALLTVTVTTLELILNLCPFGGSILPKNVSVYFSMFAYFSKDSVVKPLIRVTKKQRT